MAIKMGEYDTFIEILVFTIPFIYTLRVQFDPRNPSESVVSRVDPNTADEVTVLNKLNSKSKVLEVASAVESKS